jgi:hypothetical protein
MVVARSRMGKSTLLIKLLLYFWIKQFNQIFIFCPTYGSDNKWSAVDPYIKKGQVTVKPVLTENILRKIWQKCREKRQTHPGWNTMILMDDCMDQEAFLSQSKGSVINGLVCKGNHDGISTVWCVQKATQANTTMRLQAEGVITFYPGNAKEINCLWSDYGVGSLKWFTQMLYNATEKPYDNFFVNRQGPGKPDYYHNFRLILDKPNIA